jgi:excisionase family DNA binding protein
MTTSVVTATHCLRGCFVDGVVKIDETTDLGQLLSAREVAELLNVKVSWIYQETRAGRLPYVPLGRYRRYRRESIVRWATRLERGPGAEA